MKESNADRARDAAAEIREYALDSGESIALLIAERADETGIKASVIEAWLKRDPNFVSCECFDSSVAKKREAQSRITAQDQARARLLVEKFEPLAAIIDEIKPSALLFASLNMVGFGPSQTWRSWIACQCSDQDEAKAAFAFASKRLDERRKAKT